MNGPQQIGEELRAARLEKGWSLEHAAYETRLRHDVLGRLEEGRYDLFPSHAYVRGFIRIYAKRLGLDDALLLKTLESALGDEEVPLSELRAEMLESLSESKSRIGNKPPRPQLVGLAIIGFVILIAFAFGLFKLYRIWPALTGRVPHRMDEIAIANNTDSNPTNSTNVNTTGSATNLNNTNTVTNPIQPNTNALNGTNAPSVNHTSTTSNEGVRRAEVVRTPDEAMEVRRAEAIQPQAKEHKLRVYCEEECWVRITAVLKGKEEVIFEGSLPEESTFPPENDEPWKAESFVVTVEDASVVDIIFNDQNYGKYEAEGRASFRLPAE